MEHRVSMASIHYLWNTRLEDTEKAERTEDEEQNHNWGRGDQLVNTKEQYTRWQVGTW